MLFAGTQGISKSLSTQNLAAIDTGYSDHDRPVDVAPTSHSTRDTNEGDERDGRDGDVDVSNRPSCPLLHTDVVHDIFVHEAVQTDYAAGSEASGDGRMGKMEVNAVHTEHGDKPTVVERRNLPAPTLGMLECMNKNFIQPCTFTHVVEAQCYAM